MRNLQEDFEICRKLLKTPCHPDDVEKVIYDLFDVARKGWPEAIQRALVAEAQCAVMRRLLAEIAAKIEYWHVDMLTEEARNHGSDWARIYDDIQAVQTAFLYSAGQRLLEELGKLKAVAEEAQILIDKWSNDDIGVFDIHDLDGLRQALAELGGGEQTDD